MREAAGGDNALFGRMLAVIKKLRTRLDAFEKQHTDGQGQGTNAQRNMQRVFDEIMDMDVPDPKDEIGAVNKMTKDGVEIMKKVTESTSVGEGNTWDEN